MIEIPRWKTAKSSTILLENGQLHLWLIELANRKESLCSCLSSDELARAGQFIDRNKGQDFVATRGAVREILSGYLRVPAHDIVFSYGQLGKPEIKSPDTDLRFNLSHSQDLALLAVTMFNAVGVDIESLQLRRDISGIARRIFSSEISDHLSSLPEEKMMREFLLHWTALEARVKLTGQGVFSKVDVDIPCVNFQPVEGWIAAVATETEVPLENTWQAFKFFE